MAELTATKAAIEQEAMGKKGGGGRGKRLLLGWFEVGKLLGSGTFSKVYVGRNVRTGKLIAIKVLDKESILKGGLVAHIKREISILRRMRHPYIVELFEVMTTNPVRERR